MKPGDRADPAGKLREAEEIWRGLRAGRWSLVDHFDASSRRFVLVRWERAQATSVPLALTTRERQACAMAAKGPRTERIAEELGVSGSTVSVLLSRAATKLGVRSRVSLIRAWKARGV